MLLSILVSLPFTFEALPHDAWPSSRNSNSSLRHNFLFNSSSLFSRSYQLFFTGHFIAIIPNCYIIPAQSVMPKCYCSLFDIHEVDMAHDFCFPLLLLFSPVSFSLSLRIWLSLYDTAYIFSFPSYSLSLFPSLDSFFFFRILYQKNALYLAL